MVKQLIITILILCCSYELFAQTHPTLRTARPGNTVGAFVVGKHVLQTQTGLSFTEIISDFSETNRLQLNQVVRFGLSEMVELQLVTAYRSDNNVYAIGIPEGPKGISTNQIGFRLNISDGSTMPAMCIQYRLKTRWVDHNFRTESLGSRLIWAIGYKPIKYIALNANLGIDIDGRNLGPSGVYAFRVGWIPFPKMEFMMEYFGRARFVEDSVDEKWSSNLSFGFGYLVATNLKVDVSVGARYLEEVDQSFTEIGLSWRGFLSKKERNAVE